MAGPAGREAPTRRPQGSQPAIETDSIVDLGMVMAGQQRLEAAQQDLARRFDAIEAAWRGVRQEHDTTQSQVAHLQRSVDDLLAEQKITQKLIRRLGKLGPAVLAVVEVARYLIEHVLPSLPHH